MNGLEELINMRYEGYKWLAIHYANWTAKTFKGMPYWSGDDYQGKWDSNKPIRTIIPQKGEILALQKHRAFDRPFPINEAIEVLKRYHKQTDMVKNPNHDDMVNHPRHYTSGNIEVWDFIIDQDLNYCRGSAMKYISRAGKKDDAIQDLNKAIRFLEREIKRLETGK